MSNNAPPLSTAAKAWVGAGISTAVAVGGSLGLALADNMITPGEWVTIIVTGLVAFGGTFGGVYTTSNTPKSQLPPVPPTV